MLRFNAISGVLNFGLRDPFRLVDNYTVSGPCLNQVYGIAYYTRDGREREKMTIVNQAKVLLLAKYFAKEGLASCIQYSSIV